MKIFLKILIISLISLIVFYIINISIFSFMGSFLFFGNKVEISYHMFTYTGIMLLCSVIVSCTYIIIKKINDLNSK